MLNDTFVGLKTVRDFNNLYWVNTLNLRKGFTTIYRSLSYTTIHGLAILRKCLFQNADHKLLQ